MGNHEWWEYWCKKCKAYFEDRTFGKPTCPHCGEKP